MSKDPKWSDVTMAIINRMTSQITGKSFDPEWFILRQRFEEVDTLRTRLAEVEARLKEAERLLEANADGYVDNLTAWQAEVDAFLNPTNKDVM